MPKTTANSSTESLMGELRYKAWGEQRYSSGTTNTRRRYTGQIRESLLGGLEGMYYFNARWVDVYGSVDTIIDIYASNCVHGEIGGIYSIFGLFTGNEIKGKQFDLGFFSIQFGQP